MMLPKLNVQEEMLGEAWTHYKNMTHTVNPEACDKIFTSANLAKFIDTFMVHQSAAYVFCELCEPEQRIYYFCVIKILQDETADHLRKNWSDL